jgi:excisionase family DNA binding protein
MPRTIPKPMLFPQSLTMSEVPAALDCSVATVQRRIASGELCAVKHGRVLRVLESDLPAFIQAARRWR